jgi:N-acetylglutamate synthase-like GNAT family acetyltransferase
MQTYPSHFHINVSPANQGRGLGHALTAHFVGLCRQSGSKGIHVATGGASRALRFYESCSFSQIDARAFAPASLAVMVYSLD